MSELTGDAATAPPGRRERKKEQTRRKIFDAALALFMAKGFEATTVDDIAARADVAKGTFFNYFPRKESVIESLAEDWMEAAQDTAADRARPALARLRALYAGITDAFEKHPDLSRAVMRASAQRICRPSTDGSWRGFEELVIRVIREGQQRGELRTDTSPQVLHGVLVSCFVGSVLWWLGEQSADDTPRTRTMTLRQVVEALQGVALDGMAASAGAAR